MGSDSLWTGCKNCKKQISTSASSCPQCGAPRSRFRSAKWIAVGAAALLILGGIAGRDKAGQDEAQATRPSSVSRVNASLPAEQSRFLAVTEKFSISFASKSNELQQSMLRDERRDALLAALGSQPKVTSWRGTISRLQTNTAGKAILTVRLSPFTTVGTWNNALSDLMDETLIEKDTEVYKTLMNMKVGESVAISGGFLPSDEDGFRETSLTIRGAMTNPDFLFRFDGVQKH